jgi:NADPH-ferrihemoprotein reductase
LVVLVASSTGDGDPPDNAAKFFATMKRRSQAKGQLEGISITVLGLGDSNYTRFCAVPRTFRKRLAELGATPFYKAADCDEVDGLEDAIDEWVDGLWPQLKQQLTARLPGGEQQVLQNGSAKPEAQLGAATQSKPAAADGDLEGVPPLPACRVQLLWEDDAGRAAQVSSAERAHPTDAELAHRDDAGLYSREAPFWARIAEASLMTAVDSDRRVLHLGMDVTGSGMRYSPGDSIGVVAQNDETLVDGLLERLGAGGGRVFSVAPAASPDGLVAEGAGGGRLLEHLGWPCSLRMALLRGCDLTGVPRKSLLRLLGEHCADAGERHALLHLSSRGGRDAYNAQVRDARPSLLDVLQKYPSCAPPLDALLDALPALAPRLYSIASSPLQQPEQVDVAFSVVRMETQYGIKHGVATSWLDRLAAPLTGPQAAPDPALVKASDDTLRVPTFLRSGGAFRPPADLSKPVIYIGPGTGVAPFRGFLQHRQRHLPEFAGVPGEAWLFFGCRQKEEDFLYRQEFEGFAADGTLTQLCVAFSRAQAEKVYVQHLMREHGAALAPLVLQQGGSVFVCGDGAAMARDVQAALTDILAQHGGLSKDEAAAALAQMATEKRYVRDIWS